jgi:hypothetical protein
MEEHINSANFQYVVFLQMIPEFDVSGESLSFSDSGLSI